LGYEARLQHPVDSPGKYSSGYHKQGGKKMGLAPTVIRLATIGLGLAVPFSHGRISASTEALSPVNKSGHDIHILKHEDKTPISIIYCNFVEIYFLVSNLQGIYVIKSNNQGGSMLSKPMDILHTLMTNQLFIFAAAIVLFLLVITMANPSKSQAVSGEWWI
jgi:hypothetical protein